MSMSNQVVKIKIDGKQHEIAKLQFDQSNWMIHLDDWNTVFAYCPNLMVAITGKGEYFVKKENIGEAKLAEEVRELKMIWENEAKRIHKQTYDHEWRTHLLNQIPALDTVQKVWAHIEKKCTAYQYADREFLEGSWNKLTSQMRNVKYPAKKSTQGDKAAFIGEKINEIRSQLATLGVEKTDPQAVRLLISCMKESRWTELDYIWKQEENKREQDMDFSEFLLNIKRVYGSRGEFLDLKEETPTTKGAAFIAQEDRPRPDKCGNCGCSHPGKTCKFKDALCNKCGKKGHIARCCRSKKTTKKENGAGTATGSGNIAYSAFMIKASTILFGVVFKKVTKMAHGVEAFAPKVDQVFLQNAFGVYAEIGTLIDLELIGHPTIGGPTLYVVSKLTGADLHFAVDPLTEEEYFNFMQEDDETKSAWLIEKDELPPAWKGVKRPKEGRDEDPPSYRSDSDDE